MVRESLRLSLALALGVIFSSSSLPAADYYADADGGDDSASGQSAESAWRSLARIDSAELQPGDSVYLKRGAHWSEGLRLRASGVEGSPITVGAYGEGDDPVIQTLLVYGKHTVFQDFVVDAEKAEIDAVRLRGATSCTLRRLVIRNGTRDGIDADSSSGLLIESCVIHHFLAGSFTEQMDAHGVVVTRCKGVTLRQTEIHHVSGDCFQADPRRSLSEPSDEILLEDCHLWTGPLTEDFNTGWVKTSHRAPEERQYPGENAVDTKVSTDAWEDANRMRLTLKNVKAHGWKQDGYIANKAAFNFKEKVEVLVDGVTTYDCEVAFRVRGTRGNANVTLKNSVIRDCDVAIRAEDDLQNLAVYDTTFGDGIGVQVKFAGGSAGTPTWTWMNNTFVGEKPAVADDGTNIVIESEGDSPKSDPPPAAPSGLGYRPAE